MMIDVPKMLFELVAATMAALFRCWLPSYDVTLFFYCYWLIRSCMDDLLLLWLLAKFFFWWTEAFLGGAIR